MDLNVWTGEGNVGADPKINYIGDKGTPKMFFTIANNRGFGERVKTHWIQCVIWGDRAESIMKILKKGSRVAITGELEVDKWQKDGEWKERTSINVREINIKNKKAPSDEGNGSPDDIPDDDSPFKDDEKGSSKASDEDLDDMQDW